jgi:hypothetical protein
MKQFLPIASTLILGIFGTFGIEADEQTVLALITGLAMAGTSIWTIYKANK